MSPMPAAYDDAVAALSARGPGRMVPDLDRITALLELLGDPQLAAPSVHVTGTNGKGSVVRMVGALCSAAGLAAGTYTSPHLQTVRERLSLAGRPIGPRRFAGLYDEVADIAELLDARNVERDGPDADRLTYFELLTAMAFAWFADVPVDVAVVEVGMGGRWDATNVVRGDVAVLTTVDVDHPQLGATPAEVATEKLGIVEPGSVVVSAAQPAEVQHLLEATVAEQGATLWQVASEGQEDAFDDDPVPGHLEVVHRAIAVGGQLVDLRVGERTIEEILLPLHGAHQARNAALALGAFAALTGDAFHEMDDDVVRHGLGAVQVPGRLEVVHRDPTVLLDGAHNPDGARAAAAALTEAFEFRDLVLVVGCLADKDLTGILTGLRGAATHVIVTTSPSPRAVPVAELHAVAEQVWQGTSVAVEAIADLPDALAAAEGLANDGDGILIAGSLTTVGAARDRYLPVDEDDDDADAVVLAPEDEEELDDDPYAADPQLDALDGVDELTGAEVAEARQLLADEEAFTSALETLLEDDADEDPYGDREGREDGDA
jgi:dihydrofolate synthase / folylpolyglutamate synthase